MIVKVTGTVFRAASFSAIVEVEQYSDIYPLLNHYHHNGVVRTFHEEGPSFHYETVIETYEEVPEELLEEAK